MELKGKGKTDCSFGYLVFPSDRLPGHRFHKELAVLGQLGFLCSSLKSDKSNCKQNKNLHENQVSR